LTFRVAKTQIKGRAPAAQQQQRPSGEEFNRKTEPFQAMRRDGAPMAVHYANFFGYICRHRFDLISDEEI